MHQLVPSFILERYTAGEFHGSFPAVGMFVDISGFTAMTDALMAHGQDGAEVLANLMRSVLDPLVEYVVTQGGFVASSAGDSITALFPVTHPTGPAPLRALAAAWNIQQYLTTHAEYVTPYQSFNVSAKVGLAVGEVRWGILMSGKGDAGVYFFEGSAVDECAQAEHQARAGEIILQAELFHQVADAAQAEPMDNHYRLREVHGALPPPQPITEFHGDYEIQSHFFPKNLLTQDQSGEFRHVVSMFISLPSVRTESQLQIFIQSLFALQEKYEGFLNRLDFGDKGTNLLLFWGAPTAHENDIERALNFILDLQIVTSIPISAGITYRISHAGFIGSRLHADYTCTGRGVNLAARLMTAAPRGEIWVDQYIAERAAHRFEVEFVEERNFKGFQTPQQVFILLERKREEKPFFAGVLSGREADLEQLRQFVQPIFQERYAGMLVITGEPGLGKSRLVHSFLEDLESTRQEQFQIFLGQTDEILRQSLNPFKYWLRYYFGVAETQGESRSKRNFNHQLDDLIASTSDQQIANELDRTRSFLGALVGLHWPDSLYEQLDGPGRYQNSFIALTTLLQAESLRAPVILLLEDIHWLDSDSAAYLSQLGRILAVQENSGYPLAIMATSRSGKQHLAIDIDYSELALAGLQRQDMKTLAAQLLDSPPGEDLLTLLEQRAEGNPFYAEQILRYLKENDVLVFSQGSWQIKPGQVDTLPIEVNVLLVARLDHLTWQVKEAVQTASVLGREFEVRMLSYMLGKHDDNPLPEIAQAEQEAIWTALSELRYIFKHALLRDAAYQMQVLSRRKALHSLAVEAYETLSGTGLREHYGELAYHAEQAGLGDKASSYLTLAGSAALDAYQNDLAADYFTRALALTPPDDVSKRFELLMKREQVYQYQGKNAEREHDLAKLSALLPALDDDSKAVDVLLRQSRLALDSGQFSQVDAYSSRTVELALSVGNFDKAAVAFIYAASSSMRQGLLEKAANQARQAETLAGNCDCPVEEAKAINIVGMVATEQGKSEEAQEAFTRTLKITQDTGEIRLMTTALNNLGLVATQQWDYIEAQSYFQQTLQIAQKIGERMGEAVALGNLGFIAGSLGDFPQARLITDRYLLISREVGNPYSQSNALVNLSAWAIAEQDFESALQNGRQAVQVSQSIGDRSGEAWALTYLGHCHFAQAQLESAQQAYAQALSIRQELAQHGLACEPVAGLARVALQRGDPQEARQYVESILTHLEHGSLDGVDQPLRVEFTCYLVLEQAGDPRARRILEAAHRTLQERAARIADEPARLAFLNKIEYHRDIQAAYLVREQG